MRIVGLEKVSGGEDIVCYDFYRGKNLEITFSVGIYTTFWTIFSIGIYTTFSISTTFSTIFSIGIYTTFSISITFSTIFSIGIYTTFSISNPFSTISILISLFSSLIFFCDFLLIDFLFSFIISSYIKPL